MPSVADTQPHPACGMCNVNHIQQPRLPKGPQACRESSPCLGAVRRGTVQPGALHSLALESNLHPYPSLGSAPLANLANRVSSVLTSAISSVSVWKGCCEIIHTKHLLSALKTRGSCCRQLRPQHPGRAETEHGRPRSPHTLIRQSR